MYNDYFYIDKDIVDKKLSMLNDKESCVVRKLENDLGIIVRRVGNEYLITKSYISGIKQKYQNNYDFSVECENKNSYY